MDFIGLATAFLLQSIARVLSYNLFLRSFAGLHFHPSLDFQNANPRRLLFIGLTTFVLVAFTFNISLRSSQLVMDFITLFAAISLLTKILQSSAYLTKQSPLSSSSLSNLSRYTLDKIGLRGPPWGTPSLLGLISPFSITPACKNLRISRSVFASLIRSLSIEINLS